MIPYIYIQQNHLYKLIILELTLNSPFDTPVYIIPTCFLLYVNRHFILSVGLTGFLAYGLSCYSYQVSVQCLQLKDAFADFFCEGQLDVSCLFLEGYGEGKPSGIGCSCIYTSLEGHSPCLHHHLSSVSYIIVLKTY